MVCVCVRSKREVGLNVEILCEVANAHARQQENSKYNESGISQPTNFFHVFVFAFFDQQRLTRIIFSAVVIASAVNF